MKTAIEFQLDDNGILLSPNIHDGNLVGISLPEKGIAHLEFENQAGQKFIIEMTGVVRLICNEFSEGNIVLDVVITTGRTPNNEALQALLGFPHPDVQEPLLSKHRTWVEKIKYDVIEGRATFVEVVPSYGGEVFALCSGISFWQC